MPDDKKLLDSIFPGEDTGDEMPEEDNAGDEAPGDDPGHANDDQQETTERLYAGKYKTIEDLEAAYKEAERNFHGDRQERAELRRELEELKAALHKPKETSPEDLERRRQELLDRLAEEPDKVIEELAERIAERKVQELRQAYDPVVMQQAYNLQVQHFMNAVPDAGEYIDAMLEIVQANPELAAQPDWLERTYMQAKLARLEVKLAESGKSGQADAKRAAQMPRSGGGEKPAPKSENERLKESIFGAPTTGRKIFDD